MKDKREKIGARLMAGEIMEAWETYNEGIRHWYEMKESGEEIDIDACVDMEINNFDNARYQIMCKYIERGLDADLAEDVALNPEDYTS